MMVIRALFRCLELDWALRDTSTVVYAPTKQKDSTKQYNIETPIRKQIIVSKTHEIKKLNNKS